MDPYLNFKKLRHLTSAAIVTELAESLGDNGRVHIVWQIVYVDSLNSRFFSKFIFLNSVFGTGFAGKVL